MTKTSAITPKTLLVFDACTELASEICGEFALRGHRLLLLGSNEEQLVELDARLCQSELHRFIDVRHLRSADPNGSWLNGLPAWLAEQPATPQGAVLLCPGLQREVPDFRYAVELLRSSCQASAGAPDELPPASSPPVWPALALATFPAPTATVDPERFRPALLQAATRLSGLGVRLNLLVASQVLSPTALRHAEECAQRAGRPVQQVLERWAAALPLGQLPTAQQVATLSGVLLDDVCPHVSGAMLTLDGGYALSAWDNRDSI